MWRNEKPLRKQPHVLAWPQDLLSEVFSSRGESRFALLSPCLSTLLVISSCICDNAKVGPEAQYGPAQRLVWSLCY